MGAASVWGIGSGSCQRLMPMATLFRAELGPARSSLAQTTGSPIVGPELLGLFPVGDVVPDRADLLDDGHEQPPDGAPGH